MSVRELSRQTKGSWRTASLNELGQLYCGQSPPSSTVNANGIGTLYVSGPEQWDGHKIRQDKWTNDPKRLVPDGCIFITVKGAGVGKIFPGISCSIGRDIYAFKPKDDLSAKFIEHAIRFTVQDVLRHAVGDIPGLSKAHILQHEIGIPEPQEQERIVAEIEKQFSRLDEAIANLKRVKANLKRYKAAVEGKLTEDWRKQHPNVEPASKLLERILAIRRVQWNGRRKYKEPTPPGTNDLPSLPKGWTWATVEQLAAGYVGAIQSGPFGSQLLHSEFVDDGILAIGIDNVLDGKFSLGRQHRITPEKFMALEKFAARPCDVVITVMATVGRVCVLPQRLEPAIITKHCYRITPAHGLVDSEFLALALRADGTTRQHIFGNVRGQTRPGINGLILKVAPVLLPSFAEQKEIVTEVERRLSVIDELEAAVEANLTRADRLRQSILSQAFNGRLLSNGARG